MENDLKNGEIANPEQPHKPQPIYYPPISRPRTKAERDALKALRDKALDATFGMLRGKEILPDELA